MAASTIAVSQYADTSNRLAARLAIHNWNINSKPWFPWLASRLVPIGTVLEVGAGTGELWRHLDRSQVEHLTLTDFSEAMCQQLRRLGIENSEVKQCDATRLPFQDATFDLVIANHMLYHVDEPEAALVEFARVLKPNGKLVVCLNGRDHLVELLDLGASVGRPSTILKHAKITAEIAPQALKKHFVEVRAERAPGEFSVDTAQPVVDYLNSLAEQDLPSEKEQIARDTIESRIKEEGRFRVNKNMVLLTAKRALQTQDS